MFDLSAQPPQQELRNVLERIIITKGYIPDGKVWEHDALPSIMQSWGILFDKDEMYTSVTSLINNHEHNLKQHLILGQFTKSFKYRLTGSADSIVFHFKPTGMYRVLKKPMNLFTDKIVPLQEYLPQYQDLSRIIKTSALPEMLVYIQRFIRDNIDTKPHVPLQQTQIIADKIVQANGNISLQDIIREHGVSDRSLQRNFLEYIGVSPKTFKDIARFNYVTRMMESGNKKFTGLLYRAGYYDANHFTKDFKKMAGKTPSQYYKGKTTYEKFFYGS